MVFVTHFSVFPTTGENVVTDMCKEAVFRADAFGLRTHIRSYMFLLKDVKILTLKK